MRNKYEIGQNRANKITESINQYESELNSIFSQALRKETKSERKIREDEAKKNKEEIRNVLNEGIKDLKGQREEVIKAGPGEVPSRQKKELEGLDKEIARQEMELKNALSKVDKSFKEQFIEDQLNQKAEEFGDLFKIQRGRKNEFRERFIEKMQTKDYEGAAKVLLDAHLAKSILQEAGQKFDSVSFDKFYKEVKDDKDFNDFKAKINIREQKTFTENALSILSHMVTKLSHVLRHGNIKKSADVGIVSIKQETTSHKWRDTERFKRREEKTKQQERGV